MPIPSFVVARPLGALEASFGSLTFLFCPSATWARFPVLVVVDDPRVWHFLPLWPGNLLALLGGCACPLRPLSDKKFRRSRTVVAPFVGLRHVTGCCARERYRSPFYRRGAGCAESPRTGLSAAERSFCV